MIAIYMAKMVKINWFKAVIKNLYNLFLRKASKTKDEALNLFGDLT